MAIFSANVPKLVKYSPFKYVFKLELDHVLSADVFHFWSPIDFALITFVLSPNTWSSSSLNTYLNGTYLTSLGTIKNKIATTTWKAGGGSWDNIVNSVPKTAYQNEVGSSASSTTVDKKIGLMYVSDYYYSASPSAWTLVGYNGSDATKDYRAATSTNWLYLGSYEWTISRYSGNTNFAFNVNSTGYVEDSGVTNSFAVRPSFNLESSVKYVSGSGTIENPIRIN